MKTYKTYQECKIANPERTVHKISGEFTASSVSEHGHSLQPCNPADHCMTVKEFLDAGYRFEVGDALLFPDDVEQVQIVGPTACHTCFIDVDAANCRSMVDHKVYVLRADALESRPLKQYAVLYKGGGYSFQSDKPIGDDIIACFDLSHSEDPLSGDFLTRKHAPRLSM